MEHLGRREKPLIVLFLIVSYLIVFNLLVVIQQLENVAAFVIMEANYYLYGNSLLGLEQMKPHTHTCTALPPHNEN